MPGKRLLQFHWHGSAHAAVAFVCDQNQRARLGHNEVGAGDAHVGLDELLTQLISGLTRQVGDLFVWRRVELLLE